jgi:hypothetical protein
MAPRRDFENEERKQPSKRNWQRRPERGDDQPTRERRPGKQKKPDDVVWDWEDEDVEGEDAELGEEDGDEDDDQDDVVWDDDDR